MATETASRLYIGVVKDLHLNTQGIPILGVEDTQGRYFYPCYIGSIVAGADGRFSLNAPNIGSRVILMANPTGYSKLYIILGGILHPEDSGAIGVDGMPTAIEADNETRSSHVSPQREPYYVNQDYELTHITDVHIQNLNSYINLSDMHGLTLEGSPRVSVQLPDDVETSVFRVAAGGMALNRVLNAEPFLNRTFTYLAELKAKIDALEQMINIINPALINALNSAAVLASTPLPPPDTPINPALSTALLEQGVQVSNAATDLAASGTVRSAQSVRDAAELDKNPYVLIP